jgi:NAD(P)-dependent dehydrogenase (short-subunit alcohol dehydrogenase family)
VTRVVLTGGSGGIGRAIARAFLADGWTVANLDRARFPDGDPAGLRTIATDFADASSISAGFAAADAFLGAAPAALACCAAISRAAPFLDVASEDVDRMLAVNLRGTLLAGQEAGRRMRAAGGGRIVVITSVAAEQGWAAETVYGMTKAGQKALVQGMAVDLAPFGILVNAVAPGIVAVESAGMAGTRADPEVMRHDLERQPHGRFATPGEVAAAVLFLARAEGISGATLTVDGGFMAAGLGWFGARRAALGDAPGAAACAPAEN